MSIHTRVKRYVLLSPPKFSECFAELGVMQVRILIRQFPARGLRPHHERVHRPLDVRLVLAARVHAHGHRHERPVVAVEHLTDRLADADGEAVVVFVGLHRHLGGAGRIITDTRYLRRLTGKRGVRPAGSTGRVTGGHRVTVVRDPGTHLHL